MAKKIEELTQGEFDQFKDRLSTMQAKTIRFAVELADDMGIDRDDCVKCFALGLGTLAKISTFKHFNLE